MRWPASILETLDGAAAAARAGAPTVLAIEGRAGFGKSTLLRAATARLDGFHTLRAYGEQSAQDDRFQLVAHWHGDPAPRHTMRATRLLTEVVDGRQLTGPVALAVDDLQWVDPESVEVLTRLVERAAGDRLLVLAAHRPLGRRHPAWRRLGAPTVHLDGLDPPTAAALVASLAADAPAHLAEQLRVHTGGSPLHMRALLQEHPARELAALAARGELPAPADLAAAVDARIAELAPDAARLLHALAVLGDTWADLPTAAAVGGVTDPDTAVGVLVGEDLLRVDRASVVPRVRISHAVLRAAAYETIPVASRRVLHGAAAARLPGAGDRLRHRLAAAVGPDEGLAADLDRHADDRHDRGLFREAARFRRLAASAGAGDAARERRLLDAEVETILACDFAEVTVTGIDEHAGPHRRWVHALWLSATRRWLQAGAVLDDLDPDDLDPRNAYRARVLHGWTAFAAGRPAQALASLQVAAASPVQDGALRRLFTMTYGQIMRGMAGRDDPVWGVDDLAGTDRAALAASPDGLARLSWRGAALAVAGSTAQAVDDLTVVVNGMVEGAMDLDDGVFHAFLGFAHWCAGEWQRAHISIGLALAVTFGEVPRHPIVLAIAPLAAVVSGDDPRPSLERSRAARLAGPIPGAVCTGDVAEIAALAFAGTPQERREWRARRTADFGAPVPPTASFVPAAWMLAMGVGASWAGDADATDAWADALAAQRRGTWWQNGACWLHALADRLRGLSAPLDRVARAGLPGFASYAALAWVDAARATSDPRVRAEAEAALTRLGAGRYAATLLPGATGAGPDDPLGPLSGREREVATLLVEGLSYAQIAKELYVTRSTVSFHLTRVYAKTGTSTRHEFVQLLRGVRA